MSATTHVDSPGDAELISAVRGGDVDAYGVLFERHVGAARRLARQLVSAGDVEDLVSDAFIKVLNVLRRGGGPDVAFRAYLLTAVRRLQVDRFRSGARVQTTDDVEAFDPGEPFRDTAVEGFENAAAAAAFASLPERWQLVLWHTEVEGDRPADIAPLLGMTPNSVSALAYRAREGLRQAFLTQHAAALDDDTCRWTHAQLGSYVRDACSRRDATKVERHLEECRPCTALYLELTEVNSHLGALLAPLLLGGAAAAYVGAAAGGAAVPVGIGVLIGRLRDAVVGHAATAAVAGVAVSTVVVAGGVALGNRGADHPVGAESHEVAGTVTGSVSAGSPDRSPAARQRERRRVPAALVTPSDDVDTTPGGASPDQTTEQVSLPLPTDSPTSTGTPTDGPTSSATDGPTDGPTSGPTSGPTDAPTTTPTSSPTATPTQAPTGSPTGSPTASPTATPTATPTQVPTATPTQTPTQAPTAQPADAAVAGTVSGNRPNWDVVVSVSGLTGSTGALTIVASGADAVSTTDRRCDVVRQTVTCQLSGDGAITLKVVDGQGSTQVTASLDPAGADADAGNNSWRTVLD